MTVEMTSRTTALFRHASVVVPLRLHNHSVVLDDQLTRTLREYGLSGNWSFRQLADAIDTRG